MSGFPQMKTVAVGVPVNYSINGTTAGCVYKVVAKDMETDKVVDIRDVTTNDSGYAVASFVNLAVGAYKIEGQAVNCGKCCLAPQYVNVVVDCSVNSCGPCNSNGCSSDCSATWNVMPRNYTEGVPATTTYTLGGVPGCRLKIQFYDGDQPVIDNLTGDPLFTYLTNGVPLVAPNLTWPLGTSGRDYNWRPAPKAEQDACLQNCNISPQRLNISIAQGSDCQVSWDIQPHNPVINQSTAGHYTASGLPPGCALKVQAFRSDGVTPTLYLGQPIYADITSAGLAFSTVGATAGEVGIWKPAPTNLQPECLRNCVISPQTITVTTVGSGGPACAITIVSSVCNTNGWQMGFSGLEVGTQYLGEQSFDAGVTWSTVLGPFMAWATTEAIAVPSSSSPEHRLRVRKALDAACKSPTPTSNPCSGSSANYWCLSGNCTQATLQPAGSTGPYATLSACLSSCTSIPEAVSLALGGTFSPAPAPCSTVAPAFTWTVGVYNSLTINVTGTSTSAVTITGIPSGMARSDGLSTITIAGTPTTVGSASIVATSGSCTLTLQGTVQNTCAITWDISPTSLTPGTYATISVSGAPPNCSVGFGIYDTSNNPILIGGVHATFAVATNASGVGSSSLGPCSVAGPSRVKPLTGASQPCASGCTFSLAYKDVTCS